ncbi:IncI1 plasmid conjugative transfer integral membrane protein TraY [uncultured Candidatus Thioglobus sp.]|nr:IncI1 plasmid conjugative transfer integral membrane protein TraY [uncultured Candidatus Thioglobus sp.]
MRPLHISYLPFIPLIQWISGIAGYALFLFEAFFGSIFWAAAHAIPEEGAGVAGQHAKQGYMLVLALLVRPVLMIIGLFGGLILSKVLVNFAGNIATPFFATVHGESVVGLIGWVAGMAVMGLIAMSLVRRSFGLMHELPDRVIRWIGHSGEHLDESADERDVGSKFFGAYGRVGGQNMQKMLEGSQSGDKPGSVSNADIKTEENRPSDNRN